MHDWPANGRNSLSFQGRPPYPRPSFPACLGSSAPDPDKLVQSRACLAVCSGSLVGGRGEQTRASSNPRSMEPLIVIQAVAGRPAGRQAIDRAPLLLLPPTKKTD
jgi:hypothetical protein